jgi:L-ascorbate metabolism protein UlaG (beta-lactamase superfamily)
MLDIVEHKKHHTLDRIRELERRVPRAISRIEKKLIDFPFRRYFMGHRKPKAPKYKPNWREWPSDRLTLAWLGHSTVLINFYGTWIITDPVFTERVGIHVGPLTMGPRRLVHPPLAPKNLPPIDIVLLSHAHMDHTDVPSLCALRHVKHTVIAANTADIYRGLPLGVVQELDWHQSRVISSDAGDVRVEALEVRHAGWRMPWDSCRARGDKNGRSYNAYLVQRVGEDGLLHSFVFGGDTGYIQSFRELGDRMRAEDHEIECAIMPIGTYNPWVEAHCNPEQAWRMTLEMNSHVIVPVHWNTFTQSSEPRYEPMEWLREIVDMPHSIALSEHGQTWQYLAD